MWLSFTWTMTNYFHEMFDCLQFKILLKDRLFLLFLYNRFLNGKFLFLFLFALCIPIYNITRINILTTYTWIGSIRKYLMFVFDPFGKFQPIFLSSTAITIWFSIDIFNEWKSIRTILVLLFIFIFDIFSTILFIYFLTIILFSIIILIFLQFQSPILHF